MAHINDYTLDGVLQCGGVNHPASMPKDTMYFLEERRGIMAFGCRVCTEVHGKPQLHFLQANKDSIKIMQNTRKAEHIERNQHGTIVSFR